MSARAKKVLPKDLFKIAQCDRCQRRPRGAKDFSPWNFTMRNGVITGFVCPDCQTPEENAEAEVKLAMIDYGQRADGRITEHRKR